MRCDYPMGYDEDYLEPACEIFLQLFLQNAQIAGNEELSQDNDGTLNADFAGYESDDNSSFPSLHTISDGSLSSGELSGDEGEGLIVLSEESNFEENFAPSSFNDVLENEESSSPEIDSEVYELIDEYTDILSENHETTRSSLIVNSQNSDDISNVAFQEPDVCAAITSNNLSHQNETSFFEESSVQTDILPYDIIPSSPSTYVSLYVVVPPTSFSHESDNLLSEVSSDRLLSDVTPVSSASPSIISDNGNSPLEDESSNTVHICDNSEPSDSLAVCSSFSMSEKKKHYTTELDSALNIENSISSESTIGCDENSHPEFMFDAHLSEGISIHQDGNSDYDITSDKSVSNLKRKVVSSIDDNVINKVPKYSVSQESNDSLSEVSLDHYCAELSNPTEMPVVSDEDKIDVPSAVNIENNILPPRKATEENSIIEQQMDL